jgi:hypothetical protein
VFSETLGLAGRLLLMKPFGIRVNCSTRSFEEGIALGFIDPSFATRCEGDGLYRVRFALSFDAVNCGLRAAGTAAVYAIHAGDRHADTDVLVHRTAE